MTLSELLITTYALVILPTHHATPSAQVATQAPEVLASEEYSLTNRYKVESVNQVFSDNILLTLSYMAGQTKEGEKVDWEKVREPITYEFKLEPGKTFAFHDQVIDRYKDTVTQTTNAHFNSVQGFKSDGWLVGDGVCHLASFMNVVATEAGLEVEAPTRHDFAAIPDITREFGTSIYYVPGQTGTSSRQNLYITNTSSQTVAFLIEHTPEDSLKFEVEKME